MPVPTSSRMLCCGVLAAVVIIAGCSSPTHHSNTAAPSSEQSSAPSSMRKVSTDTTGYELTVTGAQGISAAPTGDPTVPLPGFLNSAGPAVSVTLPDGGQPTEPVMLRFDFTGKTAPRTSESLVPAVVAVSSGSPQPEVLRSRWDPATNTLTAQTSHLSSFFPIVIDFGALGRTFGDALNGYLGLASARPACVDTPLTVGDTTYVLDPPTVPAAWPCLSGVGEISVDLASNSPNGWVVRSTPPTTDMGVDITPDFGYAMNQTAYHTIFAGVIGDGTILLPGATTHLRFAKGNPPQAVMLRADPGVSLLNGLMLGFEALYPGALLLDIPGMVDCVKPLDLSRITDPGPPSDVDLGADTQALISCVTSTSSHLPGGGVPAPATIAAKSLGAVLSMGPGLAAQLAATLRGFVGEFTGENTQIITVRSDHPTATSSTADAADGGSGPGIDRIDVTTWAYDRVEGDTYEADVTGGKKFFVYWKSFAGENQVRSGCKSAVLIEGPGTDETKEKLGCDSYNPGTAIDVHSPGVYTVTVIVHQDGRPDLTAQHTVTVTPRR